MNAYLVTASALLVLTAPGAADAQDLRRRIESGPDGIVTLSYPARPDACGYGLSVLRIGSPGGGWVYSNIEGADGNRCDTGPAIAVINRAGGSVFSIRVGIGPVPAQVRGTDLGTVPAAQAAEYFLGLAERSDGRLGRDALLAGVLADHRDNATGLLRIARTSTLSRGLRESALSWLGRELALDGAGANRALISALVAMARNENEASSVRARAVNALSRAEGAATSELTALARDESREVARAALSALSRSPDPKARETLRQTARDRSLPEAVRIEAIRGLGGRDGTPAELAFVRGLWTEESLGAETRQRILQLAGEAGGTDNTRWLMGVVRDERQNANVRGRAIRAAEQAGVGSDELVKLYDQSADRTLRRAVLDALGRIGDKRSVERIKTIATNDTDPQLRRAAINWIARSGDSDARAALADLVER